MPLASEPGALLTVRGTTMLHAPSCTPAVAEAALKSLRGFRTTGRRIAWCNPSDLAGAAGVNWETWGQKFIELGHAQMLVATGAGSRELALAVRDAGLPIGRVIVCRDDVTARNVLGDSINPGDAVLALGIAADSCYKLAERLESRYERELLVAR
ncbi:MAG TPA: hypothetical protein VF175_01370 [Lacipirellula sp.]